MGRTFQFTCIVLGFAILITPTTVAQPVKPVFTNTSLDGQLIGLESDLQFGIWKPIAALAYGVNSGHFRYKAGLMLVAGLDIPEVGGHLENFSASFVDWPESPVLGREGQSGAEVGWRYGNTQFSNFIGRLWPEEGDAPQVEYLSVDSLDTYELPFDLQLSSSSQIVFGMILSTEKTFQSMVRTVSLRSGGLRLSGRWGMLENEAELPGFEFTTGVRGIAQALHGDTFWNVTLERMFSMHESSIKLSLPAEWKAFIPAALPLGLEGAFFFQAGGVAPKDPEMSETDMIFSWGISTTLSLWELSLRAELIFNQYGETTFHFGF